jgi:endo-1,3(4)-beta-glucanase
MVSDFKNAMTLGTADLTNEYTVDQEEDLSPLGITLRWEGEKGSDKFMKSHIVRGMPYATMIYSGGVLPSLFSYNGPASKPVVDGATVLECGQYEDGHISNSTTFPVKKQVKLHFRNSDFTWTVFFSQPVEIECGVTPGDEQLAEFQLNVKHIGSDKPLVVRLALMDQCTTGMSDMKQHCDQRVELQDKKGYIKLLEESMNVFPSSPTVYFEYPGDGAEERTAYINVDWAPESAGEADEEDLIMFAMPHHQHQMKESSKITEFCVITFHGSTCLVKGSKWSIAEDLSQPQSFTARRPPVASAISTLADAISEDIHYQVPEHLYRGAADTYFSGKILARVARTIVIASELKQLAEGSELEGIYDVDEDYLQASIDAAAAVKLPSETSIDNAVNDLKKCVQVWLEDAEAEYLYDKSWGGLVNCGCRYVGKGSHGVCNNTYPDCPALTDVNEDFGNGTKCLAVARYVLNGISLFPADLPGYYNDHHFHYGYHVYAAAVVAKYDPEWALQYFDKILLYIRDFANPWADDEFFTPFRQKDWWMGSSWASGIISAENSPHGRNEESSSEAIAAYESMALFGHVMTNIMEHGDSSRLETAKMVRDAGELLTISEIEATKRYWHVWSSKTHKNTYPKAYAQPVVGMLYETMASFQTWFSPLPLVSYGIQLMPFTAVGELRDDPEWASILYPIYKESCEAAADFCTENGWNIIQAGLCATAGNLEEALDQALLLSEDAFNSDGGSGNSLSNTIWYIATRPK